MESKGTEGRRGLGEKVLEGEMPFKRIRNYRRKQLRAIGDELCLNWGVSKWSSGELSGMDCGLGIQPLFKPSRAALIGCLLCSKARSCFVVHHKEQIPSLDFPSGRAVAISLCCFMDDGSPSSMKGAESSHPWCPQFIYLLSTCSSARRDSEA